MAKKTGFMKVITNRKDYIVVSRTNRLQQAPFKELVTVLDFTYKHSNHGKS